MRGGGGVIAQRINKLALDGDDWPASGIGRFTPGKDTPIPTGWTRQPVWALRSREKFLVRTPILQPEKSTILKK
jgi:hypothetical protein